MSHSEEHTAADESEEMVRLIAQAQRRLSAFVLSLVRRPTDVDDILQEINVVRWRKRETFLPGTDFVAWAFAIARLQVLAFRAKQNRREDLFDDVLLETIAAAAAAESAGYGDREDALRTCLEKLPAQQRELIQRRYQPDAAVNSLAIETGRSPKAVSESLRRIRDVLRSCIERTLAAESQT